MSKVKFIEKSHTYYTEDEREMISVSKFTELFKEKVDWDKVAQRVANKKTKEGTPTTKQEVLAKWENKRDFSAAVGTAFHLIKEEELIAETSPIFYGKACQTKQCLKQGDDKWSIPISNLENDTVYPELMIYSEEDVLCGQSDKVIVTNNKINIWDYKTDLKIDFVGYSNDWKSATKLLPPLSHLDDCNGNLYSIKMSLYMYMLVKANKGKLRPGDIIIEHVTLKRDANNDNIPILDKHGLPIVLKTEQIKLPYRKKEVEAMLALYKPTKIEY